MLALVAAHLPEDPTVLRARVMLFLLALAGFLLWKAAQSRKRLKRLKRISYDLELYWEMRKQGYELPHLRRSFEEWKKEREEQA